MAVETIYGTHVRGKAESSPPAQADPGYSETRIKNHADTLTFSAGASVGSKGYIGKLPSSALILPQSRFYFGAAGAGATLELGDSNSASGLASAVDVSAAGSADVLEAKTAGARLAPLWQHLGYSSDPGGALDLYFSITGADFTNQTAVEISLLWTDV